MECGSYNPFTLAGKFILVTGASAGIGKAIAIACARMGATVIITGRDLERLNATYSELPAGEHVAITADLTRLSNIEHLVQELPTLDGVVQCAGVGSRVLCKMIGSDDIAKVFAPNVEAPILLQTALLKHRKINKAASVVFVASKAVSFPSIGNAIYSASKGAVLAYAKCLALELAPRQIRVNCISPAMVWTELILQEGIAKEELEEAQLKYPLKRYGNPDDVAYLALYLLSDASSWMTGSNIDLTGGAREL